ncbi:vltf3-like transcription factor [Pandoravirus inopinatum]|uniref:Vltf3-like transcription factor n=1 Tax=Pandoravirus inopinatum TaxID=1605721 RepID=A0A0B5JCJ5_9VIRU|nr:vltf3-like transcription factor [Pandoravirus inopinatum]AJF97357.1 vltf3-like transcription factor [Pandoravirus inopinatum]
MDEITPLTVRRCLDVPALKDHCDFAVYVWCCVTGNEAPQLGSAKERHCWQMFEHIQASYARVKVRLASTPIDPHLSGDYVPYKFCQLLGRHECLDHLSLPRSRLQLAKFEAIWKGICEDLEWPYLTASARPCMPAPMRPACCRHSLPMPIRSTRDRAMPRSTSPRARLPACVLLTTRACLCGRAMKHHHRRRLSLARRK